MSVSIQRPINIQRRVSGRGGWLAALLGESHGRAFERVIPDLNAEGYRVVFVVMEDQFSMPYKLLQLMVAVLTAFAYWRTPGWLIIGERVDFSED